MKTCCRALASGIEQGKIKTGRRALASGIEAQDRGASDNATQREMKLSREWQRADNGNLPKTLQSQRLLKWWRDSMGPVCGSGRGR